MTRLLAFPLLAAALVLTLCGLAPLWQTPPTPPATPVTTPAEPPPVPTDQIIDGFAPATALNALDDGIRAAGGDLNTQSLRLALGFATGGFGADPIEQRAMSDTGEQFLDHLLRPGDRVSLFGFERQIGPALWDRPFDPTDPAPLAAVWGRLQSRGGGIDFNRAILDTFTQLQPAAHPNTVIALITPWPNSQVAPGVVGLEHAADLPPQAMQNAHMRRLQTVKIPFRQKDRNQARFVYVTFLVPTHFQSASLPSGKTRLDALQQESTPPLSLSGVSASPPDEDAGQSAPDTTAGDAPPAAHPAAGLIVAALVCLVIGLILLFRKPPQPPWPPLLTLTLIQPAVKGQSQFPGPWKVSETICRLVGPNVDKMEVPDVILNDRPALVFAEVRRSHDGIRLLGKYPMTVGGSPASQAGVLITRHSQTVKIEGSAAPPGLASIHFVIELEVTLQ